MTRPAWADVLRGAAARRRGPEISAQEVARAERLLGFELPEPVRELYRICGNGGGFPAILPLVLPVDGTAERSRNPFDNESSVVDYARIWADDPDPTIKTPHRLLHFYEWGCGLTSCIDVDDPSLRVVRYDPGYELSDEELGKKAGALRKQPGLFEPAFESGVHPRTAFCFLRESDRLEDWFEAWLEGHPGHVMQKMIPQRERWVSPG